ncbi:MAG: endolytic transglycosylase MltG [Acidimicrobiales bacterium]
MYLRHRRSTGGTDTEILDSEASYGCRKVVGLPPTPINSPGRASLLAAIDPAESDYLYYVLTDPSGTHTFATTNDEFLAAKQICQDLGLCG